MARLSADGTKILDNYDRYTGVPFNATKVTVYRDGSAMNDNKVDNAIYFKNRTDLGGGYSKRDYDGHIDIRWFGVVGNYNRSNGTGADDTLAIKKAISSLFPGDVLEIPLGFRMKISDTITLNKYQIEIIGNKSELHYTGTGPYAFNTGKVLSNIYPVGLKISDISIFIDAANVNTVAWGLGSSTSVFNNLQAVMTKNGQVGYEIMGDPNGSGSYYNIYNNLRAQGNQPTSTGQYWIKFTYDLAFPSRCPNANTFIGGRGGQCEFGVLVNGNGNYFYNPTIEGSKTTVFNFANPDSSVGCTGNVVYGAYVEGFSGANAFVFGANSNGNKVDMPYITSIGSGLSFIDNGLNNRWEASGNVKAHSKGFIFDSLSAVDFPTILGSGAGIKLKDRNNNIELVIRNGSAASGGTDVLNIVDLVNARTYLKAGITSIQFYGNAVLWRNDSAFGIFTISQTPEAFQTAKRGSLAINVSTGEVYIKTIDTGNTGWLKLRAAPIIDTTSVAYTKATINAAYPDAKRDFTVICDVAGYSYTKKDNSPTGNWSVIASSQLA